MTADASFSAVVEKYIQIRDAKTAYMANVKAKVSAFDNMLNKLEAVLLEEFQSKGIESIKTGQGTAYKTTRTSATVADWDALFNFIMEESAFDMLEKRVNKTAVQQYKEAHNDLPPGVGWREELTINVRRS